MVDCNFAVDDREKPPHVSSQRHTTRLSERDDPFTRILSLLRAHTSQDFSQYKKCALDYAIRCRMAACGIEKTHVYANYSQSHPEESKVLFKELLPRVTGFFRDPEAFALLRLRLLPFLLVDRLPGQVLRVWVPGCATGEEAYSLAMLLQELIDETSSAWTYRIFGNDLDGASIRTAYAGIYPLSIAEDVSPARLERFFIRRSHGYQVHHRLRKSLVFATLNVATQPPWSRLDLISCRNLMIYLEPALQDMLLSNFHRALKPAGLLLLSPSESISYGNHGFLPLSREWKLYQLSSLRLEPTSPTREITAEAEQDLRRGRSGRQVG